MLKDKSALLAQIPFDRNGRPMPAYRQIWRKLNFYNYAEAELALFEQEIRNLKARAHRAPTEEPLL